MRFDLPLEITGIQQVEERRPACHRDYWQVTLAHPAGGCALLFIPRESCGLPWVTKDRSEVVEETMERVRGE